MDSPGFLAKLKENPQEDEQEEMCEVEGEESVTGDVIAITGLGGHAYGSWRGRGKFRRMWLHDFFKVDFPRCRTMIYGYDAQISGPGNQTLIDYGRGLQDAITGIRNTKKLQQRPIFFIAHSLGGIILAHTLLETTRPPGASEPALASLYKATYAIFFFGTPHRGMDIDHIAQMIDGDENHPQRRLLNQIKADSPWLAIQLNNLRNMIDDRKIVSFYENQQTKAPEPSPDGTRYARTGKLTTEVTSDSALLQLTDQNETKIPAKGDHSTLVKFDANGHGTYLSVKHKLREFEKNARRCVAGRFGTQFDAPPHADFKSRPETQYQNAIHKYGGQSLRLPDESKNGNSELTRTMPGEADDPNNHRLSGDGFNLGRIEYDKFSTDGRSHIGAQGISKAPVTMNLQTRVQPVIGLSLDVLSVRYGAAVPILLTRCFLVVERFGLRREEIYRVPENVIGVDQIKFAFETDTLGVNLINDNLFSHNVYDFASLVKRFFEKLPDPLFSSRLYTDFINATQIKYDLARRDRLHALINSLPPTHYKVAEALFLHLDKVQKHSVHNHMTISKLATQFG
ncbi:hypothetical protein N7541_000758 [Penicillium brevicompactum]|uniref:Rho-GAP domain-containing protein n=1 Tax=Penicillium brevicompactum TaxID=5074 RepID=A0A9W9RUS8_PENBR|nr:hypothetical protein N7541_000758 [Penicillium brevicompactum]